MTGGRSRGPSAPGPAFGYALPVARWAVLVQVMWCGKDVMSEQKVRCANPRCGNSFEQRTGPGRRRSYCSPVCRRQAQRLRDTRVRGTSVPGAELGQVPIRSMRAALAALAEAERAGASLEVRVRLHANLTAHTERYLPLAVHQAWLHGMEWRDIARSTGVSEATARGRWNEGRVAQMPVPVAQALPVVGHGSSTHSGAQGTRRAVRAREHLVHALDFLLRAKGLTVAEVVQATALPANTVDGVLSGAILAVWPEVALIATVIGAVPCDLRMLWRWANGMEPPAATAGEAKESFRQAIRGLHLAAGCPAATVIAASSPSRTAISSVGAVLCGQTTTAWKAVAAVVTALDGDAWCVRSLWLAARRPSSLPGRPRALKEAPGSRDDGHGAL